MGNLFQRLRSEHERIHGVTQALDAFVDCFEESGHVQLHELIRFVTFFRGYTEGLHHEREETVLLPCLVLTGFSLEYGPLAHIRDEHRKESRMLLALEMAASAKPPWAPPDLARVVAAGHAYAAFERAHMAKEGELLFPMSEQQLLPAHAAALSAAVSSFERSRGRRWDAPWLEELATELIADHLGHRQHGPTLATRAL